MATKLEKAINREVEIDGEPHTVSLSPEGVRITKKRFRSGVSVSWSDLVKHLNKPQPMLTGPTAK